MQPGLLFTTSPWFTLLCVVVGGLYAWLLYSPVAPWSRGVNWGLGALRGGLVALIVFLLLGPRVRSIETSVDKARIVLAVDNSRSMKAAVGGDVIGRIVDTKTRLEDAGYDVSTLTLDGLLNPDSLTFDLGLTDLAGFLTSVSSSFEGQNLTDVVLLSDGIVNKGSSPAFGVYPFRVHSVAVGDTIPVSDVRIVGVRANQVAFLGNQFPIQADVAAHGMSGQQATLTLRQGQKVLATKTLKISGENYFKTEDFLVSSKEKGMHRFTLELTVASGERTQTQNLREVYVDIIDGRENILLLAIAPHPDLKVFRNVVSQNENYELDIHMLSMGPVPDELMKKRYDLLILHQIPDIYDMGNSTQVKTLLERDIPTWYFYGNQSSITSFNRTNRNVTITGEAGQNDQVTGKFNRNFQAIIFSADKLSLLEKLPPISVPFGNYALNPGSEVVLFQRIGSLDTQKPLLTININGEARKTAAFVGDGLWLWRQEEFSQTGKTEVIDEVLSKVIQLLAIKEDKRKFRVTPVSNEFTSREPVVLQTEVYNDLYEKIYGQEVTLRVVNEDNQVSTYTYVNMEEQPHFRISGLKEGVYRFTASAIVNGKNETIEGRFLVRDIYLENLNMTADHGMLRELSSKTGGRFIYQDQLDELGQQLVSAKSPDRLNSSEEVLEIIYLKWLFFVLVLLASVEWATRKYLGGY